MNYRIFGAFLIAIAIVILGTVAYKNSHRRQQSLIFSPTYMLNALWESYKKNYIENGSGRTLDKQRDAITTSEGESYTMLRAVWQDDKTTFDTSWQWTQKYLQRPEDNLFSWLYGKKPDNSYGILEAQGGHNTATDADTDIAVALLLASKRWQNDTYANEAKKIIPNIWEHDIVLINDKPYVTADNLEKNASTTVVINPSYLAPYAYRMFAEVDKNHDWLKVVDTSYNIIASSTKDKLDKTTSANLPPNWITMDKQTGKISAPPSTGNLDTHFGYDALRLPFRLTLDYQWNQEPRAKAMLDSFNFLKTVWQKNNSLGSIYGHDGTVVSSDEVPALYGGVMGYFMVSDPADADTFYKTKLQNLYQSDFQDWKQPLSYYDDNWAWFGLALYNNRLLNYFKH